MSSSTDTPAAAGPEPAASPAADRAGAGGNAPPEGDAPILPSVGKMVVRSVLGLIVGLGCGALAAWYFDVRPAEVMKNLAGVPAWAVVACIASAFGVLSFQSLRWYMVMGPLLRLPYRQAWQAQTVGQMFNAILPGRVGDLLRVQYLGRRTGKSRATILGTEIVDRWLDWWGWIPCVLLVAALAQVPGWVWKAVLIFGGILASWAIVMIVLTRRGYEPKPGSRFGEIIRLLQTGVTAFGSKRTLAIAFRQRASKSSGTSCASPPIRT